MHIAFEGVSALRCITSKLIKRVDLFFLRRPSPSSSLLIFSLFHCSSSMAPPIETTTRRRSWEIKTPILPFGYSVISTIFIFLLLLQTLQLSSSSDSDDESCLTNFYQSLEDTNKSLKNWTKTTFQSPCNGFTSYLEGATCNNGRVYKLSLSNLSLKGKISPFISNCTNLQTLDLSSNYLTGPIPSDLSSLLNLAVLNLSANSLSGPIPPQIALCAYLNVIDLHGNQLTGIIPDQLGLLVRLSVFDVSNNRLEGPVPVLLANRTGSGLPRFNESSFAGNKDLYGYPLMPMKEKSLSVLAIVGIGLGSGLLSLVLSFTAVCVWLRVTEEKNNSDGTMPVEEGKISHLMPDY